MAQSAPVSERIRRRRPMTGISPAVVHLSGGNLVLVIIVFLIALGALAMAYMFRQEVLAAGEGTDNMKNIAHAVQEGANAYLTRQFRTLAVFAVVAFLLLLALPADDLTVRAFRSVFFLVAAAANAEGRDPAMRIGFRTGATVGMLTVGLGLLGASVVVIAFGNEAPAVLEGFGFGAALLAMFMRVGGGIFTKAADVGADLVGKVEQNIPEDDPRNAATIADNVGDNVGDCAGMAADLFESYAVTLVAALILGSQVFGDKGLVFPLLIPAIGALTAVAGVYLTRPKVGENGLTTINRSFYLSSSIAAVASVVLSFLYLPGSFAGFGAAYARLDGDPRIIASAAVVIGIVMSAGILALTGSFTGTGLLTTVGVIVAMDTFGPVSDNAQGIAEMSGDVDGEGAQILTELDAVGNTTKAITKGIAIATAVLAATALFGSYTGASVDALVKAGQPASFTAQVFS